MLFDSGDLVVVVVEVVAVVGEEEWRTRIHCHPDGIVIGVN